MIKINKSSTFLAVLNRDFSVSIVDEVPENRVVFECRTMTNLELAEYYKKLYLYDTSKYGKIIEDMDVETVTKEELENLTEKITYNSLMQKKIAGELIPKFVVKIHNTDISLSEIHIDYLYNLLDRVATESFTVSEDDALFFG